jgi:hypothetical protein
MAVDGFTLLPFAFCAQIVMLDGQDLVDLGKVVAGICNTDILIGDSHGETAPIKGHDIGVAIFESGAEVWIDGLRYIVPKTARI